jgi:cytochrome c biogenesis protein
VRKLLSEEWQLAADPAGADPKESQQAPSSASDNSAGYITTAGPSGPEKDQ